MSFHFVQKVFSVTSLSNVPLKITSKLHHLTQNLKVEDIQYLKLNPSKYSITSSVHDKTSHTNTQGRDYVSFNLDCTTLLHADFATPDMASLPLSPRRVDEAFAIFSPSTWRSGYILNISVA